MGKVHSAARYVEGDATLTSPYEVDRGPPLSGPSRVGRYEIREVLGAGAMGVVYRARDPELDRDVAIKLVRDDGASPSSGVRLLREAQAMARLRHPNVLPIFDVGPTDRAVFVAMPLLEGGTLRSWLDDCSRPFDAILDHFVAAGRGLAAAHAAELVHRDFKPDNVLLGAGGEVHVADFGLARRVDGDPTPVPDGKSSGEQSRTGPLVGTPAYMAPEQLRGAPSDARADQFSFCVALWEALYGERPFPHPPRGTEHPLRARLAAIAAGPVPPPRRDRPGWIAPLLVRGLASTPDRRWPSMQALLDAIAAHRSRRRWPRWLAAGLVAVALAAAIAVATRSDPSSVPQVFPVIPLTYRADLKRAAISPDGTKLALVAGDALVIREIEADAEDHVIVDHGIADLPITWSPDGKHLLAAIVPEIAPLTETELVDVDKGVRFKLPVRGMASFLSDVEVAITEYRKRSVVILPIADHATGAVTCEVPGDYTFLWRVTGMPDGTMIVQTLKGEAYGLVILHHDCRVRASFFAEPISSVAVSDTGTIVALVAGDGFSEILEISLDGAVVSRRRVSGDLGEILGRRRGIDYVSRLALKTHLDRISPGVPPVRQLSVSGSVSFSLAPDGETLAWIENGSRTRGRLRISSLQGLSQRGRPLLDSALMAGWSPDGRSLAVLVDDGPEIAIVVIDRSGSALRRLPLHRLERAAAPVWLNEHRIAAQTDDRTTYRWFDLNTGEQGEIVDGTYGSTYWLARSPRDGMLAMWRNGPPGATHAEHLWVQAAGHEARPLHVPEAVKHHLLPSWSPSGELLVRALETGVVSRVALDTAELTPIATLQPTPVRSSFDDHVMTLANGDLLAVEVELGIAVLAVRPEDQQRSHRAREPDPGQL